MSCWFVNISFLYAVIALPFGSGASSVLVLFAWPEINPVDQFCGHFEAILAAKSVASESEHYVMDFKGKQKWCTKFDSFTFVRAYHHQHGNCHKSKSILKSMASFYQMQSDYKTAANGKLFKLLVMYTAQNIHCDFHLRHIYHILCEVHGQRRRKLYSKPNAQLPKWWSVKWATEQTRMERKKEKINIRSNPLGLECNFYSALTLYTFRELLTSYYSAHHIWTLHYPFFHLTFAEQIQTEHQMRIMIEAKNHKSLEIPFQFQSFG